MVAITAHFSLRKWYLDCVADDGTAWIGYCGDLRWGSLHIPFVSSMTDGETTSAMRSESEPRVDGERLTWSAASLGVEVSLTPLLRGPEKRLHDGVRWHCVMPCADAVVHLRDRTIRGRGYAEVLELSVPPWRLPLQGLRWGRFTGERTSLVWIEWTGAAPLRVGVCDGAFEDVEAIDDREVRMVSGRRLAMRERSVLRADTLADTLKPLGPLARLLPRALRGVVEQKWRSRGTMFAADRLIDEGWVIHELCTFAID